MKKALRDTQSLRAGCSKAKPKIFAPPQTPFPGVRDGQNLISWRWSLPLPTNSVWWGSMHAISSYHSNRPTHPHINTHTQTNPQTGPITIHWPQLARSVEMELKWFQKPKYHCDCTLSRRVFDMIGVWHSLSIAHFLVLYYHLLSDPVTRVVHKQAAREDGTVSK